MLWEELTLQWAQTPGDNSAPSSPIGGKGPQILCLALPGAKLNTDQETRFVHSVRIPFPPFEFILEWHKLERQSTAESCIV